ncbi:MAG: CAP domain-containing protein [Patescibacteria group bacterium]|jgi:hypothetical protein
MSAKKKQGRKKSKGFGQFLFDHLIPHQGNKHLPHGLRHHALFSYSATFLCLKVALIVLALGLPAASILSSATTRANIISLTNTTRANDDLPALTENTTLNSAAQAKANDMAANSYFAHTSPVGITPWDWIHGSGYTYRYAGENLAVHYQSAEDVLDGWMTSATHRENILSEKYTEIGVGIAQGTYEGYQTTFIVQMFGKPKTIASGEVAGAEDNGSLIENVKVTPTTTGYDVSVAAPTATSLAAHLSETTAPLQETVAGIWEGSIDASTMVLAKSGETLNLVVSTEDGSIDAQPAAIVSTLGEASDVYAFNNHYQILGLFELGDMNDWLSWFYVAAMLLLTSLFLIFILKKQGTPHRGVLAHSLFVIFLAGILAIL